MQLLSASAARAREVRLQWSRPNAERQCLRPPNCRLAEPLAVNATSFLGGDVVTVSWSFSATTTKSSDQIQVGPSRRGGLPICTAVWQLAGWGPSSTLLPSPANVLASSRGQVR